MEPFYDVLTSLEKMGQVVDKELESQTGDQLDFTNDFNLDLDKVVYEVPLREQHILNGISLNITPKSRILIKGESGSGKSTLLQLISGIIEPTKGKVFVNDRNLNSINRNYYRAHLGLSLADQTPFEGTIRENITFGNTSVTEDELFLVAKHVGLSSFIKESPDGLDTMLHPEGKRISFTDVKRILLARAIVGKPKLLILEDPFEHFEPKEAAGIIKFLTDTKNPWALVVVSNNETWASHCSQVITLDNGIII